MKTRKRVALGVKIIIVYEVASAIIGLWLYPKVAPLIGAFILSRSGH